MGPHVQPCPGNLVVPLAPESRAGASSTPSLPRGGLRTRHISQGNAYTLSVCFPGLTLITNQNRSQFFCLGHRRKGGGAAMPCGLTRGQRDPLMLSANPDLSPPDLTGVTFLSLDQLLFSLFHTWLQSSPFPPALPKPPPTWPVPLSSPSTWPVPLSFSESHYV